MKTDDMDDGMRPEYDFSNARRGAFTGRWTGKQRERSLREAIPGTANAVLQFAVEHVHALEATLFTLLVLGGGKEPARAVAPQLHGLDHRPCRAIRRLERELRREGMLSASLGERLEVLGQECLWLIRNGAGGTAGDALARRSHVVRLEQIGREAAALKAEADVLIRQSPVVSGLSVQEIERRTEETAKLWLAA